MEATIMAQIGLGFGMEEKMPPSCGLGLYKDYYEGSFLHSFLTRGESNYQSNFPKQDGRGVAENGGPLGRSRV